MIVPGLVSVTLRQRSVAQIVELAAECGLGAIHWGGDVHVPPGDLRAAANARELCRGAAIEVEGYGSYYRAGVSDPGEFAQVVATATALGAPRIRVWAGAVGSAEAHPRYRAQVVADLRACADSARAEGIDVVLEYHPDTLTDTLESTRSILDAVPVRSYWQPGPAPVTADCLRAVRGIRQALVGAHVFAWGPGGYTDRLALSEHGELWRAVFAELDGAPSQPQYALLEFVTDDDPDAVRRDAGTLHRLIV